MTTGGRLEYRRQLDDLRSTFLALAADVATLIAPVSRSLVDEDANELQRVSLRCAVSPDAYRDLEDSCFVFVARQAPVGMDLRHVFALVRSVNDLERTTKLLSHIAEIAREGDAPTHDPALRAHVRMLAAASERIFTAGVAAWRSADSLAINELEPLDDEVDDLQDRLLAQLFRDRHPVEVVVRAALVARWYERIGDHGVELARHVSWAVTGDRVDAPTR